MNQCHTLEFVGRAIGDLFPVAMQHSGAGIGDTMMESMLIWRWHPLKFVGALLLLTVFINLISNLNGTYGTEFFFASSEPFTREGHALLRLLLGLYCFIHWYKADVGPAKCPH